MYFIAQKCYKLVITKKVIVLNIKEVSNYNHDICQETTSTYVSEFEA